MSELAGCIFLNYARLILGNNEPTVGCKINEEVAKVNALINLRIARFSLTESLNSYAAFNASAGVTADEYLAVDGDLMM